MTTVDLDKMDGLKAEVQRRMEADLRRRVRTGLDSAGEKLRDRAPFLTGEFRDSLKPYGPPVDESWKPGDEVGYQSKLPQAARLAKGWSPRAPTGWVDVIQAETMREMEGASRGESAIVLQEGGE